MLEPKLDFQRMKQDLFVGIFECSQRGLNHSAKWLSELNYSLRNTESTQPENFQALPFNNDCGDELEAYLVSKSYFDLKEYDRSAYFTRDCERPKPRFLHFYSKYFSFEKKKLDNMTDTNCPPNPTENKELKVLCNELKSDYHENKLDGFSLYLFGIILKQLDLELAVNVFVQAVNAEPMLWSAWFELGKIIPDRNSIDSIQLPDHWMKYFFLAHAHLEQRNNDEALGLYTQLMAQGLQENTYLMAQIALGYHNRRELVRAIDLFKEIRSIDPCRLENLDTYSNLLYVHEMKTELADLAHQVVLIDKYKVETCCVIGNYYSLRSDHTKSVLYFRRALRLDPYFLSAWTLIGHEYMEMKNTNAAIQSYRHAIEINKRDYRAWYGLGQTYEILKMYSYCIHYYKQAQQLKPNDSRMIIALGEMYEKLEKTENALKCYHKAWTMGDMEGQALIKMAKLYDKLKESDNAAAAFSEYCLREDDNKVRFNEDQTEYYGAFQYLANYHLRKGQLTEAFTYAYKCLENEKTKEIAKALLKEIASRRAEHESDPEAVSMDETNVSMGENEDLENNMDVPTP